MKTRTLGLVALLAIGALTLAGCNKVEDNPEAENVEIANPASVYCEENGGTLNLEEGLCTFEDGSYCEEWAYKNGECQPGESNAVVEEGNTEEPSVGMANPASVYCVEQGGESVIMTAEDGSQYGVCRFEDGTEIEEWEYYRANNPTGEETTDEVEVVAEETPAVEETAE